MDDPISYYQKEVDALNKQVNDAGVRKISDKSPMHYRGFFPFIGIMEKLKIKKYVDFFKLAHQFKFDLYDVLSSLVFARAVNPCSKSRTFHDVLPNLFDSHDFSYDQLLDALSFIGINYEKFVEIFSVQVEKTFGLDTSKAYFDCTNFYKFLF